MLDKFTSQFEGRSITTIIYRGKPCWIVREVGSIIGYAQKGKSLVDNITREWSNEFELDIHHVVLRGNALAEFKELMDSCYLKVFVHKNTSRLMLIYEPGLYLVSTKTRKPVGARLRRFLTTEVLPQIANGLKPITSMEEKMDQNVLDRLTSQFEGQHITTIVYRGRPCWIAKEVGAVLDYANDGQKLVTRISDEWSNEFELNEHHVILKGQELAEFKQLLKTGPENGPVSSPQKGSHLMLIYEPGLHLVFTKTHKPVGVRLRKFLTSEVLPQIVRDGSYSPNRAVVNGRLTSEDRALELRKLTLEEEKIKQKKAEALEKLVALLKRTRHVSNDIILAYEITAYEEASGHNLAALKPHVEKNWTSPTEIADRLQVSPQFVGRVISKLNIRGDRNFSRQIINKAKHSDRTVTSFIYNDKGVDLIVDATRKKIKKLTQ